MTSQADARETIYQTFATDWASTSAYTFANEAFSPPVGQPWVRLTVQLQTGNQETLGDVGHRRFRREGLITMQVFVPLDTGLRAQDALVQQARNIFEGRTLTGPVWCIDADTYEIGPSDGWHQFNIDVAFAFEETR